MFKIKYPLIIISKIFLNQKKNIKKIKKKIKKIKKKKNI